MILKRLLPLFVALLALGSCVAPKNITYFQDLAQMSDSVLLVQQREIQVRPADKLSILVNSRDPQLSSLFNLPVYNNSNMNPAQSKLTAGYVSAMSGYTVDDQGDIQFPQLGALHVAGLSRDGVAKMVRQRLLESNLIKDPTVTVEFMNLTVSVLGEVSRPGRLNIDKDHFTLLDAIGQAGDLTIYGLREDVTVLRQEPDGQHVYHVNLCSAHDVVKSPVYYLQQNDVVYVKPNNTKMRQSTVNGNNVRNASFWLSVASWLTTICVLIFN